MPSPARFAGRPVDAVVFDLDGTLIDSAAAGGDRFPVRKPDAGHLLGTLELLGVPAARAVMVGDNEHDAAVARSAGTGAVLVTYGYARKPLAEIDVDARIDRLDGLLGLLGLEAASGVDKPAARP